MGSRLENFCPNWIGIHSKKHLRFAGAFLIPRKGIAMDMENSSHRRLYMRCSQKRLAFLISEKEKIQKEIFCFLPRESKEALDTYMKLYKYLDKQIATEAQYLASISDT